MELNRLVLLDEVPANAETWAQACAFRLAAARGVRGVVAHSDPEPRTRLTAHGPELIFPGHYGTIYQAKGMDYLGKTHPRRLTMLPDGSVLHGLRRLRKDNTGYDIRNLLIGAEGTLGIVTAAALKLFPPPARSGTALLVVEDPAAALDLLALAGEPAARFRVYARLLETTLSDDEADRVRIATRAPRGTISTPFVK